MFPPHITRPVAAQSRGRVTNVASSQVLANVLDAYTGDFVQQILEPGETLKTSYRSSGSMVGMT